MDEHVAIQGVDALLIPFLCSTDVAYAEELLAELVCRHAEPIITGIIKNKLRVSLRQSEGGSQNQDGLELAGDLRATIISELRDTKVKPGRRTISDFQRYVAIKSYSACADYFRDRNRHRRQLKDMLRHHLRRNARFMLWKSENSRWLCGLSSWGAQQFMVEKSDWPPGLKEVGADLFADVRGADVHRLPAADLLTVVFERTGHPLDFDHLVALAAEMWDIKDWPVESYDDDAMTQRGVLDPGIGFDKALEGRSYLETLWSEIRGLPPLQRAALLLNLRDAQGGSVIAFIPYLGIASKKEIAELIGTPYEEFSELWNNLPLDDSSIAKMFDITRQQVINLRKTGRQRLVRRMKAGEKSPLRSSGSGKKAAPFAVS